MHQCLVGVYHLLQVDRLFAVVGEGGISIEFLIGLDDILYRAGVLTTAVQKMPLAKSPR